MKGFQEAFWMLYETFWAIVLGFTISGFIQAFVPRVKITESLGNHRWSTMWKADFFGAISSSCSYAASALSNSLFKKGADFTSSMIFMFASTNLVVDLGLVSWRLLGWQFALAELVGGVIMSTLLWASLPVIFPRLKSTKEVSAHSVEAIANSKSTWGDAAGFTIGDFTMMRGELLGGFLAAGFITAYVPTNIWNAFFLHDHGALSVLEGSFIAPIIACISFVCSVGNIALAAALWHNGISFAGTISFIFADLLSFPLLLIYKKYYGLKITIKMFFSFWAIMTVSGLLTELIFRLFSLNITNRKFVVDFAREKLSLNSTFFLNITALLVVAFTYYLYHRNLGASEQFAIDPVCGMQVIKVDAPATASLGGVTYYFCMDGCRIDYLERSEKQGK